MSMARESGAEVDELFDGPAGSQMMDIADAEDSAMGPGSALLSELAANERTVHADFFNSFGMDLFDDQDLS